jgi:hypothetical protein
MPETETSAPNPIIAEFGATCCCTNYFNIILLYTLRLLTWSLPLEVWSLNCTGPLITLTHLLSKYVMKQPSNRSFPKLKKKETTVSYQISYRYVSKKGKKGIQDGREKYRHEGKENKEKK